MSRGIVLSLLQFDFSYSSAIISLSLSASIQLSLSASISKSIKDVIYHKRTPSKARFFPLSLLQKVTSTSEPILFSLQHAPFLSLWNILLFLQSIAQPVTWPPFLLRFSSDAYMGKKRPTKARSRFNMLILLIQTKVATADRFLKVEKSLPVRKFTLSKITSLKSVTLLKIELPVHRCLSLSSVSFNSLTF